MHGIEQNRRLRQCLRRNELYRNRQPSVAGPYGANGVRLPNSADSTGSTPSRNRSAATRGQAPASPDRKASAAPAISEVMWKLSTHLPGRLREGAGLVIDQPWVLEVDFREGSKKEEAAEITKPQAAVLGAQRPVKPPIRRQTMAPATHRQPAQQQVPASCPASHRRTRKRTAHFAIRVPSANGDGDNWRSQPCGSTPFRNEPRARKRSPAHGPRAADISREFVLRRGSRFSQSTPNTRPG